VAAVDFAVLLFCRSAVPPFCLSALIHTFASSFRHQSPESDKFRTMKKFPHLIAPSILGADFGNLNATIDLINSSEADWFHVDVMDGMFVPNISFGFPVMEALQRRATKPLDVHLMIEGPERYRAIRSLGLITLFIMKHVNIFRVIH
jgi:hypothetical protein